MHASGDDAPKEVGPLGATNRPEAVPLEARRRGAMSGASATAEAWGWVSRITSVGLALAIPAAAGYGIDVLGGWGPWGLVAGSVLGMAGAGTQFAALMRDVTAKSSAASGRKRI